MARVFPKAWSTLTAEERLLRLIAKDSNGCWIWQGTTKASSSGDYGVINDRGKQKRVHRLAYELWKGPIPTGLVINHLCEVRLCVNPDHLEAVTDKENKHYSMKDYCRRGHKYTEETLYLYKGKRHCKPCHNIAQKEWYYRQKTRD